MDMKHFTFGHKLLHIMTENKSIRDRLIWKVIDSQYVKYSNIA